MTEGEHSFEERHLQLGRALDRFAEVLRCNPMPGDISADAAIQRFEFSIDLFWRVLQQALRHEGTDARSPKAVLKAAYAQGWLSDEKLRLDMLEDRNRTSHAYDSRIAARILPQLPRYCDAMRAIHAELPARLTPD